METKSITDRINQLILVLKSDKTNFATRTSISTQVVSNVSTGKNNPSFEFLSKVILAFPNLNPRWLMLGEGEMWEKEKPASINLQVQNNHTVDSVSVTHEQKATYSSDPIGQCQKEVEMLKNSLRDKEEIISLLKQQLQKC